MTPDQIETATAEQQREVLEAAWRKLRGDEYVKTGVNHFYRFQALLDAEAYLDAALMLVPEGDWALAVSGSDSPFSAFRRFYGESVIQCLAKALIAMQESRDD